MIRTHRFQVIFVVQSIHYGGVLLVINLIEPVSTSFGIDYRPFFVMLIGLSSALGRIGVAHVYDFMQRKGHRVSVQRLMAYACLLVCILNLGFTMYISNYVFFSLLVCGMGALYGCMSVLAASSVIDMFGIKYVATNDGVYDLSGAVGGYVIAYGLVAVFDPTRNTDDDHGGCVGAQCYQMCFVVSAVFCLCGFLLALRLDKELQLRRKEIIAKQKQNRVAAL
jgi:hypothetical protein